MTNKIKFKCKNCKEIFWRLDDLVEHAKGCRMGDKQGVESVFAELENMANKLLERTNYQIENCVFSCSPNLLKSMDLNNGDTVTSLNVPIITDDNIVERKFEAHEYESDIFVHCYETPAIEVLKKMGIK